MSSSYPSFTKTYRTTSYPKIEPSRPELSAKDKTIIVTGGGDGSIGSDIALAFAKAGATKIAVIGRTESTLQATKSKIESAYPETQVLVVIADVSNPESIGTASHTIRETLGGWDVFISGAAWIGALTSMVAADPDDWWKTFEISVRFPQLFAKHFISKRKPNATYISLNAGMAHIPVQYAAKLSAYAVAKTASARLDEFLAMENPDLRVFTIHPGLIDTKMYRHVTTDVPAVANPEAIASQDPALPANFCVWLASKEAEFLRGRYIWVNWDVDEMVARKSELEQDSTLLKLQLAGLS